MFGFGVVSLLLAGAIFGFFYAWICSTMWGLDAADPRIAIAAMQAMNESVRNAVFAPAFFGTPVAVLITAFLAYGSGSPRAAIIFAAGGVLYLVGGLGLTLVVNVPMNEALANVAIPEDLAQAGAIWADYSPRWQVFNIIRTVISGGTLLLVGAGLMALSRHDLTA
ncbi:anthrone oxygenase family protein [Gymnodinialimonas sp. 2305UL16-5]|uniref:anthrone oxygenase family protein n=1 Tax=Gymnodinialimonas mytili TaxID=3126503 RepID=UPI00309A285D